MRQWCHGWLLLLVPCLLLAACGTPAASQTQNSGSAGQVPVEPPSPPPSASAEARQAVSVSGPVRASATASTSANASPITFGSPVLIKVGGHNLPAVLVTNNSEQQRSFTIGATWKTGDTVAGSAIGAVTGLAPHETRAVNLASQNPIPDSAGSAEAHVDKDFPTPNGFAAVARVITFGKAVVHGGSFSTLDVPAMNLDLQPHGFQVGAALLDHGTLAGTASGHVPNIGPKLTLPVSMPLAGPDSGYDQILVYVDGVTS